MTKGDVKVNENWRTDELPLKFGRNLSILLIENSFELFNRTAERNDKADQIRMKYGKLNLFIVKNCSIKMSLSRSFQRKRQCCRIQAYELNKRMIYSCIYICNKQICFQQSIMFNIFPLIL
jgi:hypothetical protein